MKLNRLYKKIKEKSKLVQKGKCCCEGKGRKLSKQPWRGQRKVKRQKKKTPVSQNKVCRQIQNRTTLRGVFKLHVREKTTGENPYWHDRWHPQAHQPGNVLDVCPFTYVDVSNEMALSDLHMKNSDDLEAKNVFTRNDYDITLFSDRGLGHAQLIVYQRRCALLDLRTANSLCILRDVMGNQLIGFLL